MGTRLRSPFGSAAHARPDPPSDTERYRGGSGTPLLLLHGISATWRVWKPVLPLLVAHHDVIAPTLLGHSGAPPLGAGVEPSLAALVDGVEADLDRLRLDTVHVAGNSMGGWIALELARRGRANSVVVFAPAGAWPSDKRFAVVVAGLTLADRVLASHGPLLERLAGTRLGRRMLVRPHFEHPERADPAEVIADLRAARNSPVVRPLLKVIMKTPLRPLSDPGCPVRVVWPGRDRLIPYERYASPMMARLPGAELVRLDGVGHVPMIDDPDAVTRLILEVTASVDGRQVHVRGGAT